jgi:hypothetical protein
MKTQKRSTKKFLMICLVITLYNLSSICAHADYHSGTLLNKSQYNSVRLWRTPSITDYGYFSINSDARNNWQSVDYSTINFTVSSADDSTYDKHYVGTTAVSGKYGEITPKKKNILGILDYAAPDDDWYHTIVKVFDNQMDNDQFTEADRIACFMHEIGHSLKLAHPTNSLDSVMLQYPLTSLTITPYDRQELLAKWQ